MEKELTFYKLLLALVLFLALLPSVLCSEMERIDVAVTAYNVDRAVIKDTRKVELRKGENSPALNAVCEYIFLVIYLGSSKSGETIVSLEF